MEDKAPFGADGFAPTVREIYPDEEHAGSPRTEESRSNPLISQPEMQNSFHDLPSPLPKSYPTGAISRKQVAAHIRPPSCPPTTLPLAVYTPISPSQRRPESMISGAFRGPVPDMYAFGGETIDNNEELERLEEEERRIDEAIQESERLKSLREGRDSMGV